MALENIGKNVMLDALGVDVDFLGLHSAFPASSGNEIAGGTPAYARQGCLWDAAASGSMLLNGTEVFDVEAGDTVAAFGLWDAVTAGTIHGGADVTDEVFGGQGTYTITEVTISIT